MELTNEIKTWFLARDIAPCFFPVLEQAGLVDLDLLKSTTFVDMCRKMDEHVARHIFFRLHPLKKMDKSVKHFLSSCGIDKEDCRFIHRLRPKTVKELKYIALDDLTSVGATVFRAKCIVCILQGKLRKSTPRQHLEEIYSGKMFGTDVENESSGPEIFSQSSEDDDDDDDDDDDEDDTRHALLKKQPKKNKRKLKDVIGRGSSSSSNKHQRSSRSSKKSKNAQSSSSGEAWYTFKDAKKLHLGEYTKELFYKYHDMFEMKRRRHAKNKWFYRVNTGTSLKVVGALLPAMDICSEMEKKKVEAAAGTLVSASGVRVSARKK
jgi:hypothetical protein